MAAKNIPVETMLKQLRDMIQNQGNTSVEDLAPKLLCEIDKIIDKHRLETNGIVDIRDYCKHSGTPTCITDNKGVVLFFNESYARETAFRDTIGQVENFNDPISLRVVAAKRSIISITNRDRIGVATGCHLQGTPIFDQNNEVKYVVIELHPEDDTYSRYRAIKRLASKRNVVQVIDNNQTQLSMELLGNNPQISEIRKLIQRVAPTDATVLITGESGSGKEVIADGIFSLSRRTDKPYVKINCTAIPPNLLESELFGYEKGAFTGANSHGKVGLFEKANHGTVLLDEIGDFPMELQPKLLRFLQQREIYRVGSNTPIKLDVRVIAATNTNLREKIRQGLFRSDLFYRISVIPIQLPPLRERPEDIMVLCNHYFREFCEKYDRAIEMPEEIKELLAKHSWPGNVRELQNIIEYYVVCSDENYSVPASEIYHLMNAEAPVPYTYETPNNTAIYDAPNKKEEPIPSVDLDLAEGTLFELRDRYERELILAALKKCSSARKAAKLLGVYPSSLYRKAQKYGIKIEEPMDDEIFDAADSI